MTSNMYLNQHFNELKTRVLKILAFFIIAFSISYIFKQDIFNFFTHPLKNNLDFSSDIIYTHLAEVFFSYLKVCLWSATLICLPFAFVQTYLFIAPGLYNNEKKYIIALIALSYSLFILGLCFAYFCLIPNVWNFFINFAQHNAHEVLLQAKISEYLSFSLQLMLAFGVSFQLPILLVILAKTGIINNLSLQKGRKYSIIIIAVFSAIITPPDIISQIILIIPMYLLYEGTILLLKKIK